MLATLVGESLCARQRFHAERWPGGECVAVEGVLLSRLPGAENMQLAFATPFARHPLRTAESWYDGEPYQLWLPASMSTTGARVLEEVVGLAAPIDAVETVAMPPGFEIVEVDSPTRRADYLCLVLGFAIPDDVAERLFPFELFSDGVTALVGYLEGRPAAAVWALATGSALGLHGTVVDPAFRGRGLLGAIVAAAIASPVATGCAHVVAETSVARESYERVGFSEVTRFKVVEPRE